MGRFRLFPDDRATAAVKFPGRESATDRKARVERERAEAREAKAKKQARARRDAGIREAADAGNRFEFPGR